MKEELKDASSSDAANEVKEEMKQEIAKQKEE